MGREIKGGWRRKTSSIWSQEVFMIKNFYRGNGVLLQVQVNTGEKEMERSVASHEGLKLMQEGLGRWQEAGEPMGDKMRETTNLETIHLDLGRTNTFWTGRHVLLEMSSRRVRERHACFTSLGVI